VRSSKAFSRYADTAAAKIFPLSLKVWPDSMAVVANLNRSDSLLIPGTVITQIDGRAASTLIDSLANYVNSDGRSVNARYQLLSNRGSFGSLYRSVYGSKDSFAISFKTPEGMNGSTWLRAYEPRADSSRMDKKNNPSTRNRPDPTRNLQVDTSLSSAYMALISLKSVSERCINCAYST
jgi:hypothetical protein